MTKHKKTTVMTKHKNTTKRLQLASNRLYDQICSVSPEPTKDNLSAP